MLRAVADEWTPAAPAVAPPAPSLANAHALRVSDPAALATLLAAHASDSPQVLAAALAAAGYADIAAMVTGNAAAGAAGGAGGGGGGGGGGDDEANMEEIEIAMQAAEVRARAGAG